MPGRLRGSCPTWCSLQTWCYPHGAWMPRRRACLGSYSSGVRRSQSASIPTSRPRDWPCLPAGQYRCRCRTSPWSRRRSLCSRCRSVPTWNAPRSSRARPSTGVRLSSVCSSRATPGGWSTISDSSRWHVRHSRSRTIRSMSRGCRSCSSGHYIAMHNSAKCSGCAVPSAGC